MNYPEETGKNVGIKTVLLNVHMPVNPVDAVGQLENVKRTLKEINSVKSSLEKYLKDNFVAVFGEEALNTKGERERNGIVYKTWPTKSTAYSKALSSIVSDLLPKTRQEEADKIIEDNTKTYYRFDAKVDDEEEGEWTRE